MRIMDLQVALNELFDLYGVICCLEKIRNNKIYMTNFDVWNMDSDGHIYKENENE